MESFRVATLSTAAKAAARPCRNQQIGKTLTTNTVKRMVQSNAAGNFPHYGSIDYDSSEDEKPNVAVGLFNMAKAAIMEDIAPPQWAEDWNDPQCLNMDYGSWEFDEEAPPARKGNPKNDLPAMKKAADSHRVHRPAADF